jgi:predicted dehydrogenase
MNSVRFGVIGLGNIGAAHADYLLKQEVARARLTAVCSSSSEKRESWRQKGLKAFSDARELMRSGETDAVIIATPHFQHKELGIEAFEAGLHLLVEKPISAHKADAERLIAARGRQPGLVFGAMFQMRVEPGYRRIRELARRDRLGRIVRVTWINTDWYRTQAYYASSPWRATWHGEGGGVLLNQSLHNLDLLQWICGMPARLQGFCSFGRFHDIEVEDDAMARLEWPDGATGVFISSTGETPGTNRLEITGTRGSIILENNRLALTRLDADSQEFCRTAAQGFLKPGARTEEIPLENASRAHAQVTQNFVDAILDGAPLIAPGEEGMHSLELANAIVYSALLGEPLELPMDGAAWERKLRQLIAKSRTRTA